MAYDELLADRMSRILKDKHISFEEKKMMGGLCFMVDHKMCVGVIRNMMMIRFDPEDTNRIQQKKGYAPMDFTKRPMKGYAYVMPSGYDMDKDLEEWIQVALDYNPKAKSSKKIRK